MLFVTLMNDQEYSAELSAAYKQKEVAVLDVHAKIREVELLRLFPGQHDRKVQGVEENS